jgi:hypothetical protein
MRRGIRRRHGKRGTELIEFALVTSFLLPLLFGTVVVGLNLGRAIQVIQVSRDTCHMYARSIDFSDPANQNIVVWLANGLGITATGGRGVVILSTVTFIGQAQCTAGGLSTGQCTNINQPVFIDRIVIGNSSARASVFGTPSAGLIDSQGNVSNYMTDASARAVGFNSVLPLAAGDVAYLTETYVVSSDYGLPGFTGTGVYSRAIF